MPRITELIAPIVIHFDGACEPINPNGNMGIGVHVSLNGKEIHTYSEAIYLGQKGYDTTSNNLAEYLAVKYALNWCIENGYNKVVHMKGDSKLVVEQLSGRWSIKHGIYKNVALSCKKLLEHFISVHLEWIPREQNTVADILSKKSLK